MKKNRGEWAPRPLALADIAREGENAFLPVELQVVGRDFDRENLALL